MKTNHEEEGSRQIKVNQEELKRIKTRNQDQFNKDILEESRRQIKVNQDESRRRIETNQDTSRRIKRKRSQKQSRQRIIKKRNLDQFKKNEN